jgi:bla regulator protein BlaR1
MESILYNIGQVLGITIIHSLWQALLIYFMLKIVLTFGNSLSPAAKYWLAVSSLMAVTGWFIYTLITEINLYNWLAVIPSKLTDMPLMLNLPAGIHQFNDQSIRYYYNIEGYLPYIAALYVLGLLFNTGKLIIARNKILAIKRSMSIDIALQYQVNKFTGILNISKKVKIGLSKLVDVPCMVGYFKPVILLPFALATYLSAEEIEAILLHELSHIKRNDYLINIFQQVIAILLFFNPCTLLINRIINEERENCCDDLVVKATADPIIYAKALLKLEQTRLYDQQLALAATGKKYYLLNRIERIMKTKKTTPSLRPALLAMLILTIGIGFIALLKPEIAEGKISVKAISPIINSVLADTTHKKTVKKTGQSQVHTYTKAHHATPTHYSQADNDKKMEELNAEIQRHSNAISQYYNSGEFKKTQEEMEELGKKMQETYNSPDLKKLQEELNKAGANLSKNYGGDEQTQELSAKMGKMGTAIGAYYNTPEFKKMNRALEDKYGVPHDRYYTDDEEKSYNDDEEKSDNYKKYRAELDTKIPPQIKQQTEELNKMGQQMSAKYETPEFKEQNRMVQALGDSLNKAYNNPGMKDQQKEMEKLSKLMETYQNNPEIKKEQELLNIAARKMEALVNSSAFKNNMDFNYNYNFNDDNDKSEKLEKIEKLEKLEKLEKVEKSEKPEKPESPDNSN